MKKQKKAVDEDGGDDFVLCSLRLENKKGEVKKKVWFVENVKMPMEAGMVCTIDGKAFHMFAKNTWIGDSGTSCHIINNILISWILL